MVTHLSPSSFDTLTGVNGFRVSKRLYNEALTSAEGILDSLEEAFLLLGQLRHPQSLCQLSQKLLLLIVKVGWGNYV